MSRILLLVLSVFFSLFCTQELCAQQSAEDLRPYTQLPKLTASLLGFAVNYDADSFEDTLVFDTKLGHNGKVIYGDIGDDLKIVVNAQGKDESVNMLILFFYSLDESSRSYDSLAITYEYRQSTEVRKDFGFRLVSAGGALNRSNDSLWVSLDSDQMTTATFSYWSADAPSGERGTSDQLLVAGGALLSFSVQHGGHLVKNDWLDVYDKPLTFEAHGVVFDMEYTGENPGVGSHRMSLEGFFPDKQVTAVGRQLSVDCVHKLPYPNVYPKSELLLTLIGIDTTNMDIDTLRIRRTWADRPPWHYDWWYNFELYDVSFSKSEDFFQILIDSAQLSRAKLRFNDSESPEYRFGSSVAWRVEPGAFIRIAIGHTRSNVGAVATTVSTPFPNPCRDRIYVDSKSPRWWAHSTSGIRVSLEIGERGELDVSNLLPGIYLLSDGEKQYGKFVKLR